MSVREPSFSIAIQEGYLLVDVATRGLVAEPPAEMMSECESLLTGQVGPEFLRSQIEVETRACRTVQEAGAELRRLRSTIARVAGRHGLAPIAASTHPFARWTEQKHTARVRYDTLARDMAAVARRLLICGMHVHVGIEDDELRIDLMNQVTYFLPHLLALSTSSPFWQGEDTGLLSYRLSVFDGMPRTGLPDRFGSFGEYRRLVERMIDVGLIDEADRLWWDVRPSHRFPTLEMRITDVCTRIDDGVTIAALYLCLLSMLHRLKNSNQRWRTYANALLKENRWLAQRYGTGGELVDFGRGAKVRYAELLEELLHLVREDAERLGCWVEVQLARDIVQRGTSAHRQLACFGAARAGGADREEALKRVVDLLVEETVLATDDT